MPLGWCLAGQHAECWRTTTSGLVCGCTHAGCACAANTSQTDAAKGVQVKRKGV